MAFFKYFQSRAGGGGSIKYKVGEVFVESFTKRNKNELREPLSNVFKSEEMVVAAANRRWERVFVESLDAYRCHRHVL